MRGMLLRSLPAISSDDDVAGHNPAISSRRVRLHGKTETGGHRKRVPLFGHDFTLEADRLRLNVQHISCTDHNPDFLPVAPASKVKTDGGFVELIFSPDYDRGLWHGKILYNKVNSENPGADYRSPTGDYTHLPATNFRLNSEYA